MPTYADLIITGLLFERICNDDDCPMKPAYELPPRERLAWAEKLSEAEKKRILIHFQEYIKKLDSNLLGGGSNQPVMRSGGYSAGQPLT